jgi:hypothetical protein
MLSCETLLKTLKNSGNFYDIPKTLNQNLEP